MDEREPVWRHIAAEQVRLVGLRFRVAGASLLAVGLVVGIGFVRYLAMVGAGLITVRQIQAARHIAPRVLTSAPLDVIYSPAISAVLGLLAVMMPLAIWQDEPPGQRDYHLVMPLRTSTHTLTRVLAGWFWLMLLTATFLAAFATFAAVVGLLPGTLPVRILYMSAWEWMVPFTAVTVAYVFASAAGVGARRPFVWLGGTVVLFIGAVSLLGMLQMPAAAAALSSVYSGFLGAGAAMAGQVDWTAGAPSLPRWLGATAIWGAAGTTLLVAAAHRRTRESA